MQDTGTENRKKQFEIIFSKTQDERFLMGLEMMEEMRQIVMRSISLANPGITEIESKIEFVSRYYRHDFPPDRFARIVQWLRDKG